MDDQLVDALDHVEITIDIRRTLFGGSMHLACAIICWRKPPGRSF